MIDDVQLNKTFKDGKMVGIFTLKLIEPNPIKKVLRVNGNMLHLSYNSKFETEISYGNGEKDIAYSNASLSKVLPSGSIVVIAGNIENISNLITDAEVLWERL